jgi:hypothetical protein
MEKESDESNSTDEIEVTPAMVRVGAETICCRWLDLRSNPSEVLYEAVAREVFLHMMAARPRVIIGECRPELPPGYIWRNEGSWLPVGSKDTAPETGQASSSTRSPAAVPAGERPGRNSLG